MNQVTKYDAMCHAIAECHRVDEAKDIRDKAKALQEYARQAKDTESERKFREIRLRAERKSGELLQQIEKAKGTQGRGNPNFVTQSLGGRVTRPPSDSSSGRVTRPPEPRIEPEVRQALTLKEMGISKDQASQWQKMADIPSEEFEIEVKKPDATTSSLVAYAEKQNTKPRVFNVNKNVVELEQAAHKFFGAILNLETCGNAFKEVGGVKAEDFTLHSVMGIKIMFETMESIRQLGFMEVRTPQELFDWINSRK